MAVAARTKRPRSAAEHVYTHSCEDMRELADDSVALTVTSPPYWNAIDYDIHAATGALKNYRTRGYSLGYRQYREYLDWCARIWTEILRVTKPGGFCAVVIGTVLLNGEHYPVPFDFTARLVQGGWRFHQDIIWHKCTAGVKRAGSVIQKPYPGYYYPNIMTEYILVFRKEGDPIYRGALPQAKARARLPINQLFVSDVANNVWHVAPVPPGTLNHPCPFPEEIPGRVIALYSYPGDLVLDPFAGSGQTLKVAGHLGRRWVGYETLAEYASYARSRIAEPLRIRKEQLVARFDKIALDAELAGPGRNGKGRGPRNLKRLAADTAQLTLTGMPSEEAPRGPPSRRSKS